MKICHYFVGPLNNGHELLDWIYYLNIARAYLYWINVQSIPLSTAYFSNRTFISNISVTDSRFDMRRSASPDLDDGYATTYYAPQESLEESSSDTIIYDLQPPAGESATGTAANTDNSADTGTTQIATVTAMPVTPLLPSAEPLSPDDTSMEATPQEAPDMEVPVPSTSDTGTVWRHGRPRGKAKPHTGDFTAPQSILQKNVRRDRVDEECIRLNIVYKRWRPLNPNQKMHLTVRDVEDSTEIPEEQEIPQWCVLCPKNWFLSNQIMTLAHYRAWHHKRLLVIGDKKYGPVNAVKSDPMGMITVPEICIGITRSASARASLPLYW